MRPTVVTGQSPTGPVPLIGPGFRGLNTELTSIAGGIDDQWALALEEAVFDEFGGVSLRQGYTDVTTSTAMTGTPTVMRTFEYEQNDGTTILVGQSDDALWSSTDDGDSWSDITGSLTWTSGRYWQFANFNGSVIGVVEGEYPASWNGSGDFAAITAASGTMPVSNGVVLSAFGRVWFGEDSTSTITYTALLDETLLATADGGGSIDLQNSWLGGTDRVTALKAFGPNWVAFGRRHILVYIDGAGSANGIDPSNMYLVDAIEGTGCIARDSVMAIGKGDVWFLSSTGVESLKRVVSSTGQGAQPLDEVSRWTRSMHQKKISVEGTNIYQSVQGVWNKENQMAVMVWPGNSYDVTVYDTRWLQEDGTARIATWEATDFRCVATRRDGALVFGGAAGNLLQYGTYRDDTGGADTTYSFVYASPWLDGGPRAADRIKLPKRVAFDVLGQDTLTIVTRWGFDFRGLEFSHTQTNDYVASGDEFGLAEWGDAEWSGGTRTRRGYTPLAGNGRVMQLYFKVTPTDTSARVSIRTLTAYMRIGRAT